MKKIILIALLNCMVSALPAQGILDSITPTQLNFYIQLVKQLNNNWGLDSTKLSNNIKTSFLRTPNSSLIQICYDERSFTINDEGRKRFETPADWGGPTCITYDTIQKTVSRSVGGWMGSGNHIAYYKDNVLELEIYRISWTEGNSDLKIYNRDKIIFKSTDTSALMFFPHPLKPGKSIAVLANKTLPLKVKSYKVLTQSGKGRNKRYLLDVITDSTSKFDFKPGNYFVSINKNKFKELEKGGVDFFLELFLPQSRLSYQCNYKSYYITKAIYSIPTYNLIDTVLWYKSHEPYAEAISIFERPIKINMNGFTPNKSRSFVRRLRKESKLGCGIEKVYTTRKDEIEKEYEKVFRDDFMLYLNKDKLKL